MIARTACAVRPWSDRPVKPSYVRLLPWGSAAGPAGNISCSRLSARKTACSHCRADAAAGTSRAQNATRLLPLRWRLSDASDLMRPSQPRKYPAHAAAVDGPHTGDCYGQQSSKMVLGSSALLSHGIVDDGLTSGDYIEP